MCRVKGKEALEAMSAGKRNESKLLERVPASIRSWSRDKLEVIFLYEEGLIGRQESAELSRVADSPDAVGVVFQKGSENGPESNSLDTYFPFAVEVKTMTTSVTKTKARNIAMEISR